ncbi:hypothetical protein K456DRAFT_1755040 [Colletotrichum gloeosporioides 23]|nr:hypothetical protein K456DRAFT_1755040 [Colletotrichum gloeosporioides 23]
MAEALSIAGTVLAIAKLSAKIRSYCVEYYKAIKNARNDIKLIRVEIDSLQGIASNALELLEGPRGAQLKASRQLAVAVRGAESHLKRLEIELRPSSARQALSRMRIRALKWPFKSKEIEATYDSQAEELSATCLPDMRVELLQKIRAWANDPTSQAVFWLKVKGTYNDFLLHEILQFIVEHDISAFLQYELEKIRADYNSDVPVLSIP